MERACAQLPLHARPKSLGRVEHDGLMADSTLLPLRDFDFCDPDKNEIAGAVQSIETVLCSDAVDIPALMAAPRPDGAFCIDTEALGPRCCPEWNWEPFAATIRVGDDSRHRPSTYPMSGALPTCGC